MNQVDIMRSTIYIFIQNLNFIELYLKLGYECYNIYLGIF